MSIQVESEELLPKDDEVEEEPIKKSRKKWKKPKDKPKRPLSAYNLFFRDERAELLTSQDCKDGKPKNIGFAALAKHIGGKWKNLDEEVKKKYTVPAEIEQVRYKIELEAWRGKQQAMQDAWQSNEDDKIETEEQSTERHTPVAKTSTPATSQEEKIHPHPGLHQLSQILPSLPKEQPPQQQQVKQRQQHIQQLQKLIQQPQQHGHHHQLQPPNWMIPMVYQEMELIRKLKRAEEEKEEAIRQLADLRRQMHAHLSSSLPQQILPQHDARLKPVVSVNELDAAKELVSFRQNSPETTPSSTAVKRKLNEIEDRESFQNLSTLIHNTSSKKRKPMQTEQKSLSLTVSKSDYLKQKNFASHSFAAENNVVAKRGFNSHLLSGSENRMKSLAGIQKRKSSSHTEKNPLRLKGSQARKARSSNAENKIRSQTAAGAKKSSSDYPLSMVAGLDPRAVMYYKDTTNLVEKLRMMEKNENSGVIINCGNSHE